MATTERPMRADARRNRDAVLDASAELLASRPDATMQELADASGLGRATVYRHFPAREDLVAALVARVADEVADAIGETLRGAGADAATVAGGAATATTGGTAAAPDTATTGGTAAAVLRRLAADGVALGSRWRFLAAVVDRSATTEDVLQRAGAAFVTWVLAAQARGELVAGDPAWIAAATRGIIDAAVETIATPDAAAEAAGDALVRAFVAR